MTAMGHQRSLGTILAQCPVSGVKRTLDMADTWNLVGRFRPEADIQGYLLQGVPKYVLTDNSRTASK